MRETIHALRCGFLCLQSSQSKRIRSRVSQHSISRLIHACAHLIDGLGHATWSATMPVSRARTLSFHKNRHFFHALVAMKRLVSLLGRLVACSARIVADTHTDQLLGGSTAVFSKASFYALAL